MTQYRADIDGLRGLSVLVVMLFHAQVPGVTGGFIGVDVFFVISGYLITSIILGDLQAGRFSLASFFERRARRILPALLVVMLASLPFAVAWLLPHDRENFFKSAVAAVFFVSNFFFYLDSGYFSAATELKPLIHTWSLAIEEQFYLLYPLALLLCRRWLPTRILQMLLGVFVLGLLAAGYLGPRYPDAAFFLPVTRAWQLMGGALLAFHQRSPSMPAHLGPRYLAESLVLVAVAVLVASVFLLNGDSPFLARTLLPSFAAVVIIACAPRARMARRILEFSPLVMLGLASYSAYLWHQPVLAFARHRWSVELSPALALGCLAVSILLALISWRLIERPFRDRARMPRRRALMTIVSLATLVSAAAIVGYRFNAQIDHWLGRDALFAELSQGLRVPAGLDAACRAGPTNDPRCRSAAEPTMLLWGDSNAMQLAKGLVDTASGLEVWQATRPGCGPFVDIAPRRGNDTEVFVRACLDDSRRLFEMIESDPAELKTVVLSSSFWRYLDPQVQIVSSAGVEPGGRMIAERQLVRGIERLEALGLRVAIVSPAPQNDVNLGRCVATARRFGGDPARCDFSLADAGERYRAAISFLRRLETRGYKVIFLEDYLCPAGRCVSSRNGMALYADESHLSDYGVAVVGPWIRAKVAAQ